MFLSSCRKLISLLILQRISLILENTLSASQFAYRPGKSTGDVLLVHKYVNTAAKAKGLEKVCIGFDMSKDSDTVQREKLQELLTARVVDTGNVTLIKQLLQNTTQSGKIKGRAFKTRIGAPQGHGLSPRLFLLYLFEALKEKEAAIYSGMKQNYARQSSAPLFHYHDYNKSQILPIPSHLEFADDLEFFAIMRLSTNESMTQSKRCSWISNCTSTNWKQNFLRTKRTQIWKKSKS